jgi:signal transduction histidine kinase/CheY-like chemotaxis protein
MFRTSHTIRTRLLIATICIVGAMFLIAAFILMEYSDVVRSYERNMRDIVAEYSVADATEELVQAYSAYVQNPGDRQLFQDFRNKQQRLEQLIERISGRRMNNETFVAFTGLRNTAHHIRDKSLEGIRALEEHDIARTQQIYDELSRQQDYIFGNTATLIMKELDAAARLQEEGYRRNVQRFSALTLVLLGVLGAAVVFAVSMTRKLTGPVTELTGIARKIAAGSSEVEVPPALTKRHDEVGSLAVAFDMMLRNLKQKIEQMNREVEVRKQAEKKAAEASEYKSLFLANMSHELRTPMNAIIGFSGLLENADLKDEEKIYMNGIHRSAKALQGIVNDILDFSKIEAGKMQLENAPFNLRETIENAVSVVSYQAGEKGIELASQVSDNFPAWVWGDATRFFQILLNLLNNAVKFTSEGSVRLTGETEALQDELCKVKICVEDTGIGIKADQVEKIMNPFTQADVSHTRRHGGTGLGLSICRSLCELMGGKLEVQSTYGEGSSFCFELIMKTLRADSRIVRRINRKTERTQSLSSFRILVADDDTTNQLVTRAMLRRIGYDCQLVSNGNEVLDALEQQDYDVVFMDVQMPGMDGIEATWRIRENPRYKRFPWIIALTANATNEDRKACLEAGMNGYLAKPVESEQIRHALMNVELAI